MSGIYIKGLEMPKGLGKTITIYPNGRVRVWVNNKGSGELLEQGAVPVPEHGPLVDALKVINTFPEEFIFTNEQAGSLTNYIIPADTAEEGER